MGFDTRGCVWRHPVCGRDVMFGLPIEATLGIISTVGGFVMKHMAQKRANQHALLKMSIQQTRELSLSANLAAKRSSPWLRKFAAVTVLLVAFGGILLVSFFPDIPVSMPYDKTAKSFLGIFKWGGGKEVLIANGFVIEEWFKFSVITIVHFLFGSGCAKITN